MAVCNDDPEQIHRVHTEQTCINLYTQQMKSIQEKQRIHKFVIHNAFTDIKRLLTPVWGCKQLYFQQIFAHKLY